MFQHIQENCIFLPPIFDATQNLIFKATIRLVTMFARLAGKTWWSCLCLLGRRLYIAMSDGRARAFMISAKEFVQNRVSFRAMDFAAHAGLSSFLSHCFHANSLQRGMSVCRARLKAQRFQICEPRHVLRRKDRNSRLITFKICL